MRRLPAVVALTATVLATASCTAAEDVAVPRCDATERLAVVAQAVPRAAYVPCLGALSQGWVAGDFTVRDGSSGFSLTADRGGGRPVEVVLSGRCELGSASPARPRAEGVRSSVRLVSLSPTYAGVLYDVFPGGCLRSEFAFDRGPHIPLLEELSAAVDLVRRTELQLRLRDELGVELDR